MGGDSQAAQPPPPSAEDGEMADEAAHRDVRYEENLRKAKEGRAELQVPPVGGEKPRGSSSVGSEGSSEAPHPLSREVLYQPR